MDVPAASEEVITTIYMVGFPEDYKERELHNMFAFAGGFEGCTLRLCATPLTMPATGRRQRGAPAPEVGGGALPPPEALPASRQAEPPRRCTAHPHRARGAS